MTEQQFRLVLRWFAAVSGCSQKHELGDEIKRTMPGVEPWTWRTIDAKRVKFP